MWKLGSKIKDNFNLFSKELEIDAKCIGFSPRLKLIFNGSDGNDSLLYKSFFLQDLIENGIFMHPNTILLSYSHTMEQIDYTLEFIHKSMKNLKSAIKNNEVEAKLKGNIAKSVIHRLE